MERSIIFINAVAFPEPTYINPEDGGSMFFRNFLI
jgi:hypothetical protein